MMHGTPLLAPELWNLSVVILLCALMGWIVRLVRLMLLYLESRFSLQQNAVIHLEKLGPSLQVLRHASMWHFQQLLRTQLQGVATTMKRVRVPFEIISSSVRLVETLDEQHQPRMHLSIEVKSATKCAVQVFWHVKTSALEGACQIPITPRVNWPIKRRHRLVNAVLPVRTAINAVRSLPGKVYNMDMAKTPHELLDDDINKDNGDDEVIRSSSQARLCLARLFVGANSFQSCSVMERRKDGGDDEYVTSIPSELLAAPCPEEMIQSCIVATDCENEDVTESPGDSSNNNSRYACVIAIGSTDLLDKVERPKSPGLRLPKRLSTGTDHPEDEDEGEVLCQCVAIDFLPTRAKQSRAPVIVKKLHFTATNVFSSQAIFGRSGSECVICLERPQAAILLPCRHFCVCHACLEEIDQCPICRAKFSTYACYQADPELPGAHIQLQVT